MSLIQEFIFALLFVASSGILFNERFRRNTVLISIVGLIAIISSYFLTVQIINSVVDKRILGASVNERAPNETDPATGLIISSEIPADASSKTATKPSDSIPIIYGKSYPEARELLIQAGWIPTRTRWQDREKLWALPSAIWQYGFQEIDDCAGSGLGQCRFSFHNPYGRTLNVVTVGNPEGDIDYEKNEYISDVSFADFTVEEFWIDSD